MNFSKTVLLLLSAPLFVAAEPCLTSFNEDTESCDYDHLSAVVAGLLANTSCDHGVDEEIALILDVDTEEEAKTALARICAAGDLPFSSITNEGSIFDKEYYDGGTYWNEERENLDENGIYNDRLNDDPGRRINQIYEDFSEEQGISMPSYVDNFEGCDLRAVMCCFVQDRQANDDNGNCATPYADNCVDANPADNTDICYAEYGKAPTSSRTTDGYAIFQHNDEDDSHCHGFAWAQDPTDKSARFRGNNLFYVSMYDHFYTRGYVRNVPGAPMCGCLEKMPTVTRSDCTQIDVNDEATTFTYGGEENGLTATITSVDIEFNACQGANNNNNDLEAYYEQLVDDGKATEDELDEVRETLVGEDNCPRAIGQFLDLQGLYQPNRGDTDAPTASPTTSAQPTPGDLDAEMSNLALKGTASQSSTCHGGVASRAIDGNTSSRWGSRSITHTCKNDGSWWKVDLADEESVIEKIVVWNRLDCCSYRLNDSAVRVLDKDGDVVASEYIGLATDVRTFEFTFDDRRVIGKTVEVQHLGVRDYLSLSEVEVYGRDGADARRLGESVESASTKLRGKVSS